MPIITSIKPQKKKERFNIFLDGRYAFSLAQETVVKEKLKIDQNISLEEIQKLVKEGEYSLLFDKTLKFLSFRPRSVKEIEQYLTKKQAGEETQKMILQKLSLLNFIDDSAFAKWWIEQRSNFSPRGIALLKMELRQKGICREIIDEVIHNNEQPIDEKNEAIKLAEKKFKMVKNLPLNEAKTKLYGFLARRGFSYTVIEEVIDNLLKRE